MLALIKSLASGNVAVGPHSVGGVLNEALIVTVVSFATLVTNRISPPEVRACPTVSPWAAAKTICVTVGRLATAPPAKTNGAPPNAA
jgi:hypothetical protein